MRSNKDDKERYTVVKGLIDNNEAKTIKRIFEYYIKVPMVARKIGMPITSLRRKINNPGLINAIEMRLLADAFDVEFEKIAKIVNNSF